MRFRAYCDDCKWKAPDSWSDEDNAYTDLNNHVQYEHAGLYGVRQELDGVSQ